MLMKLARLAGSTSVFVLLAVSLGPIANARSQSAQVASAFSPTEDDTDAKIFAIVFRQVHQFAEKAASAKSPDAPEAGLAKVIPRQLDLSEFDAASLVRFSEAWFTESTQLKAKLVVAVTAFREAVSHSVDDPSAKAEAAAHLKEVQTEIRSLTLRYRDSLRNSMRSADYEAAHKILVKHLATTPTPVEPYY